MFEPELQIEDMERTGIDVHVLSSADVIQSRSWATPSEEARLSALTNDECLAWAQRHPTRFITTAVLPLGETTHTLNELQRIEQAGVRILTLPSNYRGAYLGSPRFHELWAAVHEHGLTVFVHPEGVQDLWFQDYAMWNSIGQSIEEVKVMTSLIYEGVLDRFPDVRIVMAHGGGYMPYYMGRLDRNMVDKPFTAKNISKLPSEYLTHFYYDSCVYDAHTLEVLVERVGAERIVLGGDYPVGGFDPLQFIDSADLTLTQKADIAGGNSARLLSLV